jgi:hypothetical protein
MIADLNVHWDIGEDGQPKPHAHVMLTMREVTKRRLWREGARLEQDPPWSSSGASAGPNMSTERLAERDIDARDRSPQPGGAGHSAGAAGQDRPRRLPHWRSRGLEAERIEEHRAVAQRNGERIIASPADSRSTRSRTSQATFTKPRSGDAFVHRHSDGKRAVRRRLMMRGARIARPDRAGQGRTRRRTGSHREQMIETEQRLHSAANAIDAASTERTGVDQTGRGTPLWRQRCRHAACSCPASRNAAFEHVTDKAAVLQCRRRLRGDRQKRHAGRGARGLGKRGQSPCAARRYPESPPRGWSTAPALRIAHHCQP